MSYHQRHAVLFVVMILSFVPSRAGGHCDALDGPVVLAAKAALQAGVVTPVLKWVRSADEEQIREAFVKALKVRALGDDAREVADLYFSETLVRVHRAGEGVAFTGLKPAGGINPGIAAADDALDRGSADKLADGISGAIAAGLRERFAKVIAAKTRADESAERGRAYVAAYTEYVHYVEAIHELGTNPAGEQHHIHDSE